MHSNQQEKGSIFVTSVAAVGSASANYSHVTFSVVIKEKAKTLKETKELLKQKVNDFLTLLDKNVKEHNVLVTKNTKQSSYSFSKDEKYDKDTQSYNQVGFVGTYQFSFCSKSLENMSSFFDKMSESEGFQIAPLNFFIKDREALNKKALKDAFTKVKDRFAAECEVMSLNKDDYDIASWQASYNDSRTNSVNYEFMSGASNSLPKVNDEIAINPGMAIVNVNLDVLFIRKEINQINQISQLIKSSQKEASQQKNNTIGFKQE